METMLARPTESVLVEPEDSSRGGPHDQQHKHPLQDAEASEYQQDGIPGEYWTGHERVGGGTNPMRRPPRRRPTPTCVGRDGSFLEVHAVKNSARYHQALQEFLKHTLVAENPLVADATVDEALVALFN